MVYPTAPLTAVQLNVADVVLILVVLKPPGIPQGGVAVVKLDREENALRFPLPQSVCT
jgi:hypothetical protein